jgi:GNAT superfamily N-acetyltransferase
VGRRAKPAFGRGENASREARMTGTLNGMDIAVTRLDPTDQQGIAQAYEIVAAVTATDLPDFPPQCRYSFFAQFGHPWPGNESEFFLARVNGEAVGFASIEIPVLDNIENLLVEISVHPHHRRGGIGRALHAHIVGRARELGRKRLIGAAPASRPGGPERDPAGSAFAQRMGARSALVEVRRRLDLASVDEAVLDAMLAEAWKRAAGYSLVRWRDRAPDEYIDDVAYLDGRMVQDAPMGDLAWEPEKVDRARMRGAEEALDHRGRRRYHSGVRHDATDRLVAWSSLSLSKTVDWHSWQQNTIVEPNHRGHRLGTIVKIENLRYALATEPGLLHIDTFNAASNAHMISINEAMGFRPVDAWHDWQQVL